MSSYYGLGSYLAWLFTSFNTILSHFHAENTVETSTLDVAGWIVVALYLVVVTFDAMIRVFARLSGDVSFVSDPQYRAASVVSQWGTIIMFPFLIPVPRNPVDRHGGEFGGFTTFPELLVPYPLSLRTYL